MLDTKHTVKHAKTKGNTLTQVNLDEVRLTRVEQTQDILQGMGYKIKQEI